MDAARFDRLARRLSRRAALRVGGAGTLALGARPAVAAAQPATPEAAPAAEPVAFLYIQTAEGGAFRPTAEPGLYDLELRHAGGTTLAFADRPAREVRVIPTVEALATIGFTPVPPNAALVTGPADGEAVVVLELLAGSYDGATGTLAYRVRVLAETERPALATTIAGRSVVAPPAGFGHANLVIDDVAGCDPSPCPAGQTCCGGVCRDLQTDVTNCGSCGYDCSAATDQSQCEGGTCVCPTWAYNCGNACVEFCDSRYDYYNERYRDCMADIGDCGYCLAYVGCYGDFDVADCGNFIYCPGDPP